MKLYRYDSDNMLYNKINFLKFYIITIILLLLSFIAGCSVKEHQITTRIIKGEPIVIKDYVEKFSEKALRNYLNELNVSNIEIVIAQSKLETSNYSSQVFMENHNLFGMKESQRRVTTNKGSNLNHAYYDNWKDSALDYAIYQSIYLKDLNQQQYLNYLGERYAEDALYVNKIKKLINK